MNKKVCASKCAAESSGMKLCLAFLLFLFAAGTINAADFSLWSYKMKVRFAGYT